MLQTPPPPPHFLLCGEAGCVSGGVCARRGAQLPILTCAMFINKKIRPVLTARSGMFPTNSQVVLSSFSLLSLPPSPSDLWGVSCWNIYGTVINKMISGSYVFNLVFQTHMQSILRKTALAYFKLVSSCAATMIHIKGQHCRFCYISYCVSALRCKQTCRSEREGKHLCLFVFPF